MSKLYLGHIVHCKVFGEVELIPDGFLVVQDGKIVDIGKQSGSALDKYSKLEQRVLLNDKQFLMPGFIDCHIHAPQMPNIGLGLDKDLLGWLMAYTFPLEAQYTDLVFAESVYKKVVARTLTNGTTCAAYFATNDLEASKILVNEVIQQGQRAFVGKVASNTCCPDYYIEKTADSIKQNINFIEFVLAKKNSLVQPIITPRFALSCDTELMSQLAALAQKYNLNIQTHLSESIGEVSAIKKNYPDCTTYTSVYDSVELLTKKCIMAHCVHLEDNEIALLEERGTSVAHCPSSNINLSSGLCDVKRLRKFGVKVGLGTDVAGGTNVSILGELRQALNVSHSLEFIKKQCIKGCGQIKELADKCNSDYVPLTYKEVLYLATLGGAEALSLSDRIGNFSIGKEFDALLVDVGVSPIDQYEMPSALTATKTPEEKLLACVEKFLYVGDDRNITNVYVNGRQVI